MESDYEKVAAIISKYGGNRSSLEASCTLPVEPGQVILTNSEKVRNGRKLIVELLLASCPNSKVLQDMAANMGVNKIRFKIKDRGCILCGLCVRYCKEQMKSGGIGFISRGISWGWQLSLMLHQKSAAIAVVVSGYVLFANEPAPLAI